MTKELEGRRVAFLVANDGIEQVELTDPWRAVENAGGSPVLIAPEAGTVQARHHLDGGDTFAQRRDQHAHGDDAKEGGQVHVAQ